MPYITATPVPAAGLIQVDVDWTDSRVDFARLERVRVDTGEVQTVRPHTAILTALGQFMRMSNGRGRWFDTDAPMDVPVIYRIYNSATPTTPWYGSTPGTIVQDLFGRTVGAGATWGTPDLGPAYASAFSVTTEASVAGGEGTLTLPAENVTRGQHPAPLVNRTDWQVRYRIGLDTVPTGDSVYQWTYLRLDGPVNNYMSFGVQFRPDSLVSWQAAKEVAGVSTNIGSGLAGFSFSASVGVEVRAEINGDYARLRMWAQGATEPTTWLSEVHIPDLSHTPGRVAVAAFIPTASTTALPMVFDFDNLAVAGSDEAHAAQVTLDSEGHAWLRDPLRPCSSLRMQECVDVSACADSNLGFEEGTAAGWSPVNASLVAQVGASLAGRYRGQLTSSFSAGQDFGLDSVWSTTRYTFDATAEGWAGEAGVAIAQVASPVHDGTGALRATKTMGAGFDSVRFNDASGLPDDISAAGPTLSMWALVPLGAAGTGWQAHIEVQDSSFTWQPGTNVSLVPGTWKLLTYTAPAGLLANSRAVGVQFSATAVGGSQAVYIDTVRQGAQPAAALDARLAVTPGAWVRATGWLMAPVDLTQARLAVNWISATGAYLSTSAFPLVPLLAGNWTRFDVLAEAPASTAEAELMWTLTGTPAAGTIIYGDAFTFEYRLPDRGIFFASMDVERREANSSSVAPVNRRLAITASRPRRGVDSNLTLASASFEDRDALIEITVPGTPLLFSAPAEYGIPQRYWDVGTTEVGRGLPDHRFQPRIHQLPIGEREAPAGPGEAPCGTSYADGCAIPGQSTWAEVQALGLTWLNLIDVT